MRRHHLLYGYLLWLLLPGPVLVRAAEGPDLNAIGRQIAKEPKYVAKRPLYGLYVFGPDAKTHVWAVFDKSKAELDHYDVLFFDRNADGDLTGPDERIAGTRTGGGATFPVGQFTDRISRQQHRVTVHRSEGPQGRVMIHVDWCGKVMVRGGYAPNPGPYTQFAATPAEAPILWPAADGPFGFQFWTLDPLAIGRETDVRVFLGHPGHGRNTFCAVPDTFLPSTVPVLATLVYADKTGKEQRVRSELRERC